MSTRQKVELILLRRLYEAKRAYDRSIYPVARAKAISAMDDAIQTIMLFDSGTYDGNEQELLER